MKSIKFPFSVRNQKSKIKFFLFFAFFSSFSLFSYSQGKKVIAKQFRNCESVTGINFDDFQKKNFKSKYEISILIIRAESSHENGIETIIPIDNYINNYDTSLIHIYTFELKYTKGSSSCAFNYLINGHKESIKGNPPFFCLTSQNDSLLQILKNEFNLEYSENSNRYLFFSDPYNTDKSFYLLLNRILNIYNVEYVNSIRINENEKELKRLKNIIILDSNHNSFISVTHSPALLIKFSELFPKSSLFSLKNTKLQSFQCNYTKHFIKNSNFGLGFGLAYSNFNTHLVTNSSTHIIDTLDTKAIDRDGTPYRRIGMADGIEEIISVEYISSLANLSYKLLNKEKGYLSLIVGFRFSNVINSTYQAINGKMSWQGFYKQYDTLNYMFDESYGFYNDTMPFSGLKNLEIKKSFISGFISFAGGINLTKSWLINVSLYGELGSNLINSNVKDTRLAYSINNYNSLLYRINRFNINSVGLQFGLTYSF